MLTDEQDELLDNLQNHALRLIYGANLSGRRMREMAGITTLRERRIDHCDKFASKCVNSERYSTWFPLNGGRSTRGSLPYKETYARCSRLYDSPLYYMRRRLNGKEEKKYGERYRVYRQ